MSAKTNLNTFVCDSVQRARCDAVTRRHTVLEAVTRTKRDIYKKLFKERNPVFFSFYNHLLNFIEFVLKYILLSVQRGFTQD